VTHGPRLFDRNQAITALTDRVIRATAFAVVVVGFS
jgi:hypothetical protein